MFTIDWFYCDCCKRNGLASVKVPVCTGCANKLLNNKYEDSPVSYEEIKLYCERIINAG